jgi:hypothetical protein
MYFRVILKLNVVNGQDSLIKVGLPYWVADEER